MSPRDDNERLLEHFAWVRELARRLVRDDATAEDVAQQTWLAALERPPRHVLNLRAWLGRIVQRTAARSRRAERRRRDHEAARPDPGGSPSTDEVVRRADLQRQLVEIVMGLEDPYRATLLLRFFEGLAPAEISAREEVPVETVRTRLKRGMQRVRREYERRQGSARGGVIALALVGGLPPESWGPTALSASAPAATGVIMMSKTAKIGAVALVAVAAVAVGWQLTGSEDDGLEVTSTTQGETSDRETETRRHVPVGRTEAAPEIAAGPGDTPRVKQPGTDRSPLPMRLRGHVRDALGRPVANAVVLAGDPSREPYRPLGSLTRLLAAVSSNLAYPAEMLKDPGRTTRTRADGSWSLDGLAAGENWSVAAIHLDHGAGVRTGLTLSEVHPSVVVDLELPGGIVVHGTVRDRKGEAIAGARVSVTGGNGNSITLLARMTTDEEGRFESFPLPFRVLMPAAVADGFFHHGEAMRTFDGNEREWQVDFKLDRETVWRGRLVTAAGDAAGLAGAIEELCGSAEKSKRYLERHPALLHVAWRDPFEHADAVLPQFRSGDGRIDVETSTYEVKARRNPKAWLAVTVGTSLLGASPFGDAENGPDIVVDLGRLPPPDEDGRLRILVRDASSGGPVKDFAAKLVRLDPGRLMPQKTVHDGRTNSDAGRLEVPGLDHGPYELRVEADGFATDYRHVRVDREDMGIEVGLARADAVIAGAVVDEAGEPVNDARIYLYHGDGRPVGVSFGHHRRTNASGAFRFEGLAVGDYVVAAERYEYAPTSTRITARPRDENVRLTVTRGVRVTLKPQDGVVGPLRAEVVDAAGQPVTDDRFNNVNRIHQVGLRLAPGNYTAKVFCPGYEPASVTFTARTDEEVRFEMKPVK